MKKSLIILLLIISGVAGFSLSLWMHSSPNVPAMETYHYPATFVKQLAGDTDAGKKIFKEFCGACHDKNPAIDVNAPRIGDPRWKSLKNAEKSALLGVTIRGVGAMPARGGCFECSDAQLEMAIEYMLDQSP